MRRHIRGHRVGVLSSGLVALPVLAQDTEITSARFRVEAETTAALSLAVENVRDSALVAWRIELVPGGAAEANFIGSLFPWSPGLGRSRFTKREPSRFTGDPVRRVARPSSRRRFSPNGYYQGSGPAFETLLAALKGRTRVHGLHRESA